MTFQIVLNLGLDILKFSTELFKQDGAFVGWPPFAAALQSDRQIDRFPPKQPQCRLQSVRSFCDFEPILVGRGPL